MSGFIATIVEVTDGDTIVVQADLMPLLGIEGEVRHHVRLLGINAPEKTTPEGKAAKSWMTGLALNKECLVGLAHPDKYGGRVDADIWLTGDATTLSQRAIDSGHAKFWDGKGQKPT